MAAEENDVQTCTRCGFSTTETYAHCIQCSAPMVNRCTNSGGLTGDACSHENPTDAAYCAKCGAPTIFTKLGIIQPRHTYLSQNEADLEEMTQLEHLDW